MRRHSLRAATVVVAALILAGCGSGSEGGGTDFGGESRGGDPVAAPAFSAVPEAPATTVAAVADTDTAPSAASPTTVPEPAAPASQGQPGPVPPTTAPAAQQAAPAAPATTVPPADDHDHAGESHADETKGGTPLPEVADSWPSCFNAEQRYVVAYPRGWNTDMSAAGGCQYFDPAAVKVPANRDSFRTALMALQTGRDFANPGSASSREPTTISGRQAIRFTATEAGLQRYGYWVERDGKMFEVSTVRPSDMSDGDFAARKAVVDRAAQSLEFQSAAGGGG